MAEQRQPSSKKAAPNGYCRDQDRRNRRSYPGNSSRADVLPAYGESDGDTAELSVLQRTTAASMTQRQMQLERDREISNEVEATAREIAERDEHMRHVESQMLDINEVYRDLNSLIIDQGDALNSIEANMDTVTAAVAKGTQEVVTANAYHKKWSFGWW